MKVKITVKSKPKSIMVGNAYAMGISTDGRSSARATPLEYCKAHAKMIPINEHPKRRSTSRSDVLEIACALLASDVLRDLAIRSSLVSIMPSVPNIAVSDCCPFWLLPPRRYFCSAPKVVFLVHVDISNNLMIGASLSEPHTT